MPNEIVYVTVTGANGNKTIPVTVSVDPTTGAGSQTFTYTGINGGSDTISASAVLAGTSYSSNVAQANWQVTNNTIQLVTPVTCYVWNDSPHSGPTDQYIWSSGQRALGTAMANATGNSLSFDTYVSNASDSADPLWYTLASDGTNIDSTSFPPYKSNFNCIILSSLLVPSAGTYSLSLSYKDEVLCGIGSSTTGAVPTWSGKGTYKGSYGITQTVNGGFPLISTPWTTGQGENGGVGTGTTSINFPQAGLYPIEVNWDYWYHTGRILHAQVNSNEICPVIYIGFPPSGATPTGNLVITPVGGSPNFQFVGQPLTLTVNITGIVYTTQPYIPLFEGTSGTLPLYNDSVNPVFTLQTYNGNAVNKLAAASNIFSLSGDNGGWQGKMSVTYDGTNFQLTYNGVTPNAHVDATLLTISADDISWYNPTSSTFDLFSTSGSVGGVSTQITLDWFSKLSIASVSPTTITANGSSQVLNVILTNPLSPRQIGTGYNTGNTISAAFTITGSISSVTGTQATYDSDGWLTGWAVTVTAPSSTFNGSSTLYANITGTLTYLSGTTIITNQPVSYFSGAVATINTIGSNYLSPIEYSFSVSPTTTNYTTNTLITYTGVVFQGINNPVTLNFIGVNQTTNSQFALAGGVQQSRVVGTLNGQSGWITTFMASGYSDNYPSGGASIGFIATDSTSGLTVTYLTSTLYYYGTSSSSSSTWSGVL